VVRLIRHSRSPSLLAKIERRRQALARGILIAESLKVGAKLAAVPLGVISITELKQETSPWASLGSGP
jgi:hypothetical protein